MSSTLSGLLGYAAGQDSGTARDGRGLATTTLRSLRAVLRLSGSLRGEGNLDACDSNGCEICTALYFIGLKP